MYRKLFVGGLILTMVGCSGQNDLTEDGTQSQVEDQQVITVLSTPEVITDKLQIPWAINKIGNVFYISERPGTIVKVEKDKKVRQRVVLEKSLATAPEAGLLGFVLAPDFNSTNNAFAYYTYLENENQFSRIVELEQRAIDGEEEWHETRLLLDKIPSDTVHHGGRLELGPDEKLYATTGDASTPELAQRLNSLAGKILRLNLDGTIPKDNPNTNSYVYSYGHRNPQGLAWDETGRLFASEHGPQAHDEINLIEPGKNYGWPNVVGAATKQGMVAPLFQSGAETWAPSGMVFYKNKLYVATLRGNAVREFDLEKMTTQKVITGLGRIRDTFVEGNTIYFVSNNTDGRGTPAVNDDKLFKMEMNDH